MRARWEEDWPIREWKVRIAVAGRRFKEEKWGTKGFASITWSQNVKAKT